MITLFTTLYEKNKDYLLSDNNQMTNINFDLITEKIIGINNVNLKLEDYEKMKNLTDKYNIHFLIINDSVDKVKNFFNLDINDKTLGYYYTIQYFSFILNCKTDYLLLCASDCDPVINDDYLINSINELNDEDVITTSVIWGGDNNKIPDFYPAIGEQEFTFNFLNIEKENKNFWYNIGFSDQFFMTKIDKIKNCDFNLYHKLGDRFPGYGGMSFEKRLSNYLTINKKFRAIYNKGYYTTKKYNDR